MNGDTITDWIGTGPLGEQGSRGWFDGPELLDADNDLVLSHVAVVEQARVTQLLGLVAVDVEQSYRRDAATSLSSWLVTRGGYRKSEALGLVKLVRVLRRVPGLLEALEAGYCTVAHVEVLAGYATVAREHGLEPFARQLVADAGVFPPAEFEALCAHWADLVDQNLTEPPGVDGSYLNLTPSLFGESDIRGHLTADQTETFAAALDTLNGPDPKNAPIQRTVGQRNADALTDMAAHLLNQPPSKDTDPDRKASAATRRGSRPTAVVTLDLDTALDRSRELGFADIGDQTDLIAIRRQLLRGGPLPKEVAELFLCDANLRRMIVGGQGQPLNMGRPVPTITTGQRLALQVRDGGCVFPTCDRPAQWCDAHHVKFRADGGPTDVDNLVLLCRHHHRVVHGHRWNLQRDPTTGI
ncbi:MAG: DUF222 domain-containing protein, partial [Actinomycetota bacterium]|nr:DUF222 domain-containing protein [Actinomycetota bacterium]